MYRSAKSDNSREIKEYTNGLWILMTPKEKEEFVDRSLTNRYAKKKWKWRYTGGYSDLYKSIAKHANNAVVYEKVGDLLVKNKAIRAAEMYEEGAKLIEKTDPEKAIELFD